MKRQISEELKVQKSALYVRVSTVYQIDKDSIPLQREDLINYSKYVLGIDNYEVFEDAGYSGKNTDRPDYQRMMSRIRTGEFSHLVVWKIDRISRNLIDFSEMYEELKQIGCVFVSKNEQFDTSSAMGEAMLKIILVFAELERKITGERVTAVMVNRAEQGLWNGGKIPFGYNYDKETKTFSVNADEAKIVETIYSLYEQKRSLIGVVREINEKGLRQRSGAAWNPTTVSIILKSPFYVGDYVYFKRSEPKGGSHTAIMRNETDWVTVENHHIPLVEKGRQAAILSVLESKRRSNKDSAKTYQRKNTHIFGGLCFCYNCGSQMQSTTDKQRDNGFKPSVYVCSRRRRFEDCTNKYVTDVTLGPFILNYIANVIKLQNNFGKSTTIDMMEKKLLRGETFRFVTGIEHQGLEEMFMLLRSRLGKSDKTEFEPIFLASKLKEEKPASDEKDLLLSEKRKKERALKRLLALYMYGDDTLTEKDFVVEKQSLQEGIEKIDARIAEIDKASEAEMPISDEEFLSKATYFIMSNQLNDRRYINFNTFMQKADKKVLKTKFVKGFFCKSYKLFNNSPRSVWNEGLNLSYKCHDNQYNTNYNADDTPYSNNEFQFRTF